MHLGSTVTRDHGDCAVAAIAATELEQLLSKIRSNWAGSAHEFAFILGRYHCREDDRLKWQITYSSVGNEHSVAIDLPEIAKRQMQLDCISTLLCHTHPDGNPRPSRSDRNMTARLATLCQWLNFPLIDHIIFAQQGVFSFRNAGLL
ncbi:MAG: JAB domain-containing protein [Parasphingorhabdus sp.]|nr:JAB domain-containing protein [Parasphingorhabdus sp.]